MAKPVKRKPGPKSKVDKQARKQMWQDFYINDLSFVQIGEKWGVNATTVRNHVIQHFYERTSRGFCGNRRGRLGGPRP